MIEMLEYIKTSVSVKHGVNLHYAASVNQKIELTDLLPGERALYEKHETKSAFLQGRAALKKLCNSLSFSADTSKIAFPSPYFSLTHCKSWAIAMYCEPSIHFDGFGIDLEFVHPLNATHAEFFLDEDECSNRFSYTPESLTQIWTIKEALFKSDVGAQSVDFKQYKLNMSDKSARKQITQFVFESNMSNSWFFSLALRSSQSRRRV